MTLLTLAATATTGVVAAPHTNNEATVIIDNLASQKLTLNDVEGFQKGEKGCFTVLNNRNMRAVQAPGVDPKIQGMTMNKGALFDIAFCREFTGAHPHIGSSDNYQINFKNMPGKRGVFFRTLAAKFQ